MYRHMPGLKWSQSITDYCGKLENQFSFISEENPKMSEVVATKTNDRLTNGKYDTLTKFI